MKFLVIKSGYEIFEKKFLLDEYVTREIRTTDLRVRDRYLIHFTTEA